MSIRLEAERCAKSAQEGVGLFGIDDLALAVTVIELSFRFWQACSRVSTPREAMATCVSASTEPTHFRKARRRVRRAAVNKGVWLSEESLNDLTNHMLDHVADAGVSGDLGACCSESHIADEEFDD